MLQLLRPSLGLLLALTLLAGCASSKPESAPARLNDKPGQLVLITALGALDRGALDDVIDLYVTKHPNVKVKVKEIQSVELFGEGGEVNRSVLEGGDLAFLTSYAAQKVWAEGAARDLSSLKLPAFDPLVADLIEQISTVDGRRIGLPVRLDPVLMLLGDEAFTMVGIEKPPVDWTLQDFEQLLAVMKRREPQPALDARFMLTPAITAFGGQIYNPQTQEWAFDSPQAREGLEWLRRQLKGGLIAGAQERSSVTYRLGGANGSLLMPVLTGTWIPMLKGVSLQPLPRGPKGRSAPIAATLGLVLTSAPNPEAAADFLREMVAGPEAQRLLAKGSIRPVLPDTAAQSAWREVVGERNAEAMDLSLQGGHPEESLASAQLLSGLDPYFQGKSTLDELLPALKRRLSK